MFILLALVACAPEAVEAVEAEAGFVPNECGTVAAFQEDRSWTWAYVSGSESAGDWSSAVKMLKGSTARVEMQGNLTSSEFTQDYTLTSEYECAAGTWLVEQELQAAGVNGGVAYTTHTLTTYAEPVLVWPADLENGAEWTSTYIGTANTDGTKTSVNYSMSYSVKAPMEIEVEGGQFRAFLVIATTDEGVESRLWLARETGLVKGQDYELTALW